MTRNYQRRPMDSRLEAEVDQLDVNGCVDTDHLHGLTRPIGTLADQLATLGRTLAGEFSDLDTARVDVLGVVLRALPAMSWASLTFGPGHRPPVTLAASADTALRVDTIQYDTGVGPCLQALADSATVRADDLAAEGRWAPFVAATLADTPVRAVVSCSLADGGHPEVSLNMYASRQLDPQLLDPEIVAAVAAACSVALSAIDQRHRAEHLNRALLSGRRIGAAMGILMASRRLTEQQAFDELRVASQHSQRKLRDLADDVLLTGELPSGPLPWHQSEPAPPKATRS